MQTNNPNANANQGGGMQGNFGNVWGQAPFVKRFEMSVMQYVILNKAKQGEVTKDNLQQTFRGNLQMSSDHFEHCVKQLVADGHLREVGGNKYTITDDGREDVEKIQRYIPELQQLTGGGQTQQRSSVTTTQTTGGTTGGQTGGSQGGGYGGGMGKTGGATGQTGSSGQTGGSTGQTGGEKRR
ncbi:MAG TPA: hypothetical protein VHH36_04215 [Candidatus Thermoplasmatota archaeon]|nr:hypothetical protein [Candidatus Thermoplasmatota archaeon]